jgi:CRP/FNR family transcriptional regulator, anaerobic regulatory protein
VYPIGGKIGRATSVSSLRTSGSHPRTACPSCTLINWCPAANVDSKGRKALADFAGEQYSLKRNKRLFRSGFPVKSLYVIRSGSMKTVNAEGRVTRFFIAGDMVGVCGISEDIYSCNAIALEDSIVCGISMDWLEDISRTIPPLRRHFYQVLSREMARAYDIPQLYNGKRSDRSLATFLLELSKRYAARGCSATHFNLRMMPEEIASHLGLTPQAVNRAFARLDEEQLVAMRNGTVDIKNLAALQRTVGEPALRRSPFDRSETITFEGDGYTNAA